MRLAALLDLETTGLDPSEDRAIEVAVTLYDLVQATPIESFASLIRHSENAAFAVNRIALGALGQAPHWDRVWPRVRLLFDRADVIIAHRCDFDRSFLPIELQVLRPFVCSKFHIQWPMGKLGDSLVTLALAHGVGVVAAHRAAVDVDILARLLTRASEMIMNDDRPEGLVGLMVHAMRPRTKVAAIVSYEDRELAKAAGFTWEPAAKRWEREIPVDEIAALPFQTRPL